MTRRVSESGFTLLEVLVASMLLGMLITILTMVFNSSSIAWSTGRASAVDMNEVRKTMSAAEIVADNAIPRADANSPANWGILVSPWDSNEKKPRKRAIVEMLKHPIGRQVWSAMDPKIPIDKNKVGPGKWNRKEGEQLWASSKSVQTDDTSADVKDIVVGVWSYGPDRLPNTGDDISTWPDLD